MIISQDTTAYFNNYELMFVTGHPRSGTTITHALVCSSEEVNDYVPESSYLTGLVNNFITGFNNDAHNVDFFGGKQAFVDYAGKQIRNFVNDCWIGFGAPKTLALKDPLMMAGLDAFKGIFPFAKFVITLRDPYEVVSSFCKVRQRQGAVVDAAMTEGLARNAALDYERAARFKAANSNQVLLFHYDSLFDGSYLKKLSAFSPNIVCNPDKVWESNFVSKKQKKDSAWHTEKYGEKPENITRNEPELNDAQRSIVKRVTVPSYEKVIREL
ncbi:sulfotransferase [Thalassospira sp.]|uniref:sulfotransferase family protein n=1 Tax=Thalassospira sp. TaxID=1912094 RepID=UPI001B2463A6|nr:sulfotransferase [Thalassospira sp.]MBO6807602.1 sulfotransferase [Thalassospira sp.]MBO6840127.1 sulfotransferase [Thalassospira sp.]